MKWKMQIKMVSLLLFMSSCISYEANAQIQVYDTDDRRVEVVFNRTLTKRDLTQIQQTMFEYGIVLRYDAVVFDRKGRLEGIEFTVDFKDGFAGSAKTESLRKNSRFGFFRDYAADATVSMLPFGAGDLDEISSSQN